MSGKLVCNMLVYTDCGVLSSMHQSWAMNMLLARFSWQGSPLSPPGAPSPSIPRSLLSPDREINDLSRLLFP